MFLWVPLSTARKLICVTLHDIVHTERSITLVFEYLDRDLKQYMDEYGHAHMSLNNVKIFLFQLVCLHLNCLVNSRIPSETFIIKSMLPECFVWKVRLSSLKGIRTAETGTSTDARLNPKNGL